MPTPVTKENQQPSEKLRMASARRSTTGRLKVRLSDDEAYSGDSRNPRTGGDCLITEPVPAWALFEHIFEAAEKQGEQHDAQVVCASQQRQIRFIDAD